MTAYSGVLNSVRVKGERATTDHFVNRKTKWIMYFIIHLEEKLEVKRLQTHHPNDIWITQKDKWQIISFVWLTNGLTNSMCKLTKNVLFCAPAVWSLLGYLLWKPSQIPWLRQNQRCFSALKRTNHFLEVLWDRLNVLAMLSVEQEFIQKSPDFNDMVINLFPSQRGRWCKLLVTFYSLSAPNHSKEHAVCY